MSTRRGILAGLTRVDPAAYRGRSFERGCEGCERDVDRYVEILQPLGYDLEVLKTPSATSTAILDALEAAASSLAAGDMLVFCFSGHGFFVPDRDGDEARAATDDGIPGSTGRDDAGAHDELLLAYDRPIVDDTLGKLWPKFRPGVRILMISDCCNSGTNFQLTSSGSATGAQVPLLGAATLPANLIHLGAARDQQLSAGFGVGGALTLAIVEVWNRGFFRGNYHEFHAQIARVMQRSGPFQVPTLHALGVDAAEFLNQRPFDH